MDGIGREIPGIKLPSSNQAEGMISFLELEVIKVETPCAASNRKIYYTHNYSVFVHSKISENNILFDSFNALILLPPPSIMKSSELTILSSN